MANEIKGGKALKQSKDRLAFYQEFGSKQQVTIIRFSPPEGDQDLIQLAKYEAARYSTEHKVKTFTSLGCEVIQHQLDYYISPNQFQAILKQVNDSSVGVIVQNPFPERLQSSLRLISFEKDLDGMRPNNPYFSVSATSETIFRLVEPFVQGNDVVAVVGAQGFVGSGVTKLLQEAGINTLALDAGDDLTQTRRANLVVSATGVPELLDERHIIPAHRLVVDAGFIPLADSPILGDVNRSAYDIPQNITPVPGGVGPFQMATLMERLVVQVTGQQIERWQYPLPSVQEQQTQVQPPAKPTLGDWPKYAAAIGKGTPYRAWVELTVATIQQGQPVSRPYKRSLEKDFGKYRQTIGKLDRWHTIAIALDKQPDYLQQISMAKQAFEGGEPLSERTKADLAQDFNQWDYNRLSTGINSENPQAFLARVAASAFKEGIFPKRVQRILSLSPVVQTVQNQQGKKAAQAFIAEATKEGLKIRNRGQPRQSISRQQNMQKSQSQSQSQDFGL